MEKINQDIKEILLIKEQLKSENLEKINFDNLFLQLDKVQVLYENYQQINTEFQPLHQNIINKIRTMEKAIHAVTKKRPNIEELELKLQKLSKMNSLELLETFDRTESKFHASFPSTFRIENQNMNRIKNYKSYK